MATATREATVRTPCRIRMNHIEACNCNVGCGCRFNGKGVLFVDEDANDQQVDALTEIFFGRAGGMPWEALAGTFESFEGPVRKPIEMSFEGNRSGFRIPDVLEVRHQPVKDPVTGADKNVHIVYPDGGFFWNDASICTTEVMRIAYDGMRFEHPGWFASSAIAEWTNQA